MWLLVFARRFGRSLARHSFFFFHLVGDEESKSALEEKKERKKGKMQCLKGRNRRDSCGTRAKPRWTHSEVLTLSPGMDFNAR